MTTVYRYNYYCNDESTYIYEWGTTMPICCKNNISHTIGPVSITETVSSNTVTATEPTEGYFLSEGIKMSIPSSTGLSVQVISWPYDIMIWRSEFLSVTGMLNDELNIRVGNEQTTIGTLLQAANTGVYSIVASPTAIQYMYSGHNIYLSDGVTIESCGRTTSMNLNSSIINLETPTIKYYDTGALVKMSMFIVKNLLIDTECYRFEFGKKGFRGKSVPANTPLSLEYTNNNGFAKDFIMRVEYYHGFEIKL